MVGDGGAPSGTRARLVHADHVLPGDAPPIVDGAVVVADGDDGAARGEILDVGPAAELRARHAGAEIVRVHGVVFPGLVNAHTHLELSAMRGRVVGGRGFVPWVEELLGQRVESSPEDDAAAIEDAVDALVRAGTVAVGDVTNGLGAVMPLARRGLSGAVFHEVFGQDRAAVLARAEGLRAEVEERVPSWPSGQLTYAPAPHTLYTTHEDAVRALLDGAKRRGAISSLHLAEHDAERRAVEEGEGPVPAWLLARAKQRPAWPKVPLFELAERVGALHPGVLLVHLTVARPDELARVARAGASAVLCPRSNLYIEGRLPPLLAARAAGVSLALGTDSLASNTSLDVLAEARALADRFSTVPSWELVAMATWGGARALGRRDLGRFAKGARPGVYGVEGAAGASGADFLLAHLDLPRRALSPHGARVPQTPDRGASPS